MAQRNDASDVGRKGAPNHTKQTHGYIYVPTTAKGKWLPAYSGGTGRSAIEVDPDIGSADDEVGNDFDNDYDDAQ
jgi:hypothetical protein